MFSRISQNKLKMHLVSVMFYLCISSHTKANEPLIKVRCLFPSHVEWFIHENVLFDLISMLCQVAWAWGQVLPTVKVRRVLVQQENGLMERLGAFGLQKPHVT